MNKCLVAEGYPAAWSNDAGTNAMTRFLQFGIRNNVVRSTDWGFFDVAAAASFGYQVPSDHIAALQTPDLPSTLPRVQLDECRHKIDQTVGGLPAFELVADSSLPNGGPGRVPRTGAVAIVLSQWSRCMGDSGLSYLDPKEAESDPRWQGTSTVSKAQIRTAIADVKCKIETNLVGVELVAQDKIDRQYIASHHDRLATWHAAVQALARAAGD